MKTVLSFDSFKGSLSAGEVCLAVADGIQSVRSDIEVATCPMADGGEGTADVLMTALNGKWIPKTVTGPFPEMRVSAGFVWLPETRTAVVEMAKASGLPLLRPKEYNPLKTTTFGTGELVRAAVEQGAQKILLTVGGSATVDGGVGAAEALGWRFSDAGEIIPPEQMQLPEINVLCDINNPLCGPSGAAKVYGPQKGATPEMVEELESRLQRLAGKIADALDKDVRNLPGAGAAGGLAAGAVAFMNATLVSGVDTVMKAVRLENSLQGAEWVLTGEGRLDSQSLRGKVVDGVIRLARKMNVKVGVIAGNIRLNEREQSIAGIHRAMALQRAGVSLEEAICRCRTLLFEAGATFARDL